MRRMTATAGSIVTEQSRSRMVLLCCKEHLKKSFGDNDVLRDINLVMNKGETSSYSGNPEPANQYS